MSPSEAHERRRSSLDATAVLMGCTVEFPSLPDGTIPDVLRVRPSDRMLVVGEAKATETAGCRETRARIDRYLDWLGVHCRQHPGLVAVCHGPEDGLTWLRMLRDACVDHGLPIGVSDAFLLAPDLVTWVLVSNGPGFGPPLDEPTNPRYRRGTWPPIRTTPSKTWASPRSTCSAAPVG